jgi:hypothetical protein
MRSTGFLTLLAIQIQTCLVTAGGSGEMDMVINFPGMLRPRAAAAAGANVFVSFYISELGLLSGRER